MCTNPAWPVCIQHWWNTVQEWSLVRFLSACEKTHKFSCLVTSPLTSAFSKLYNCSWKGFCDPPLQMECLGVSLLQNIHYNWICYLFMCLYDKMWFCYVQLALHIHIAHVIVHFTHVTDPLSPQSIHCLMLWVKLAISWDLSQPHSLAPFSHVLPPLKQ